MKLSSLLSLISSLRSQSRQLSEKSERRLIVAASSGTAVLLSTVVGWICYYVFHNILAFTSGTILSAGILLPLFIIAGNRIADSARDRLVTSGNIFDRMRYLDQEYRDDVQRIGQSPLSDAKKEELVADRYDKFLADTDGFREQIRTLQDPWETNLIRRLPGTRK
jgi:hypothetical protein